MKSSLASVTVVLKSLINMWVYFATNWQPTYNIHTAKL